MWFETIFESIHSRWSGLWGTLLVTGTFPQDSGSALWNTCSTAHCTGTHRRKRGLCKGKGCPYGLHGRSHQTSVLNSSALFSTLHDFSSLYRGLESARLGSFHHVDLRKRLAQGCQLLETWGGSHCCPSAGPRIAEWFWMLCWKGAARTWHITRDKEQAQCWHAGSDMGTPSIAIISSLCGHQKKIHEHGVVMSSCCESQDCLSTWGVWKADSESMGCSMSQGREALGERGHSLMEKGDQETSLDYVQQEYSSARAWSAALPGDRRGRYYSDKFCQVEYVLTLLDWGAPSVKCLCGTWHKVGLQ